MLNVIKREPALVSGLIAAVIALVAAFGLDLTNEQVGAIMAVVAAVLALVTRQSVTPNVSVAAAVANPPAGQPVAGPAAAAAEGTPVDVVPADSDPDLYEGKHSTELGAASLGYMAFWTLIVVVAVVLVLSLT